MILERKQRGNRTYLTFFLQKKKKIRIVCISDYGEKLLERYEYRKEAYEKGLVIGFVKNKD